ncbi:MAG: hypothetical protein GX764_08065 [Firmicutes bacterium]|nr:hypothetical protein [Bacillota bacterium]
MLNIKKKVSVMLMIFFLFSGLPISYAADYRAAALEYLAEELSVSADSIVVDGSLQDFPYLGEQYWVGHYHVQGAESSGGGVDGAPNGDMIDTPAVIGEDARAEILPAPDSGFSQAYDPGVREAGVLAICVESGEFYIDDEAQLIFEKERNLQQQEWERLSKEAGKIAVELYKKVTEASADELFKVIIEPLYIETAEMREAIKQIEEEFSDLQVCRPEGRQPAAGLPQVDGNEAEEVTILPAPLPDDFQGVDVPAVSGSSMDEPVSDCVLRVEGEDEEWFERFEEMQRRLEEVRREGFAESLAKIEAALQEMNAKFEREPQIPAVKAELTADQILSLKDADFLVYIFEEQHYTIMEEQAIAESASALDARQVSIADAVDADGEEESESSSLWAIIIGLVTIGAGAGTFAVVRRRKR